MNERLKTCSTSTPAAGSTTNSLCATVDKRLSNSWKIPRKIACLGHEAVPVGFVGDGRHHHLIQLHVDANGRDAATAIAQAPAANARKPGTSLIPELVCPSDKSKMRLTRSPLVPLPPNA